MRHDHVGQSKPRAQIVKQREQRRPDQKIQTGRRFIENDQARVERGGRILMDISQLPAQPPLGRFVQRIDPDAIERDIALWAGHPT